MSPVRTPPWKDYHPSNLTPVQGPKQRKVSLSHKDTAGPTRKNACSGTRPSSRVQTSFEADSPLSTSKTEFSVFSNSPLYGSINPQDNFQNTPSSSSRTGTSNTATHPRTTCYPNICQCPGRHIEMPRTYPRPLPRFFGAPQALLRPPSDVSRSPDELSTHLLKKALPSNKTRSFLGKSFAKQIVLRSAVLSDPKGTIDLEKDPGISSVLFSGPGSAGPNRSYKYFLLCDDLPKNFLSNHEIRKKTPPLLDTRIKTFLETDAYFQNEENSVELITNARMILLLFAETTDEKFRLVSHPFLEFFIKDFVRAKHERSVSGPDGAWKAFLDSSSRVGLTLSSDLKRVDLVSYFEVFYSGFSNEKTGLEGISNYKHIDIQFKTISLDVKEPRGRSEKEESGLQELKLKFERSPCLEERNKGKKFTCISVKSFNVEVRVE